MSVHFTYKGVNYVADVNGSYQDADSLSDLNGANVNAVALTADFGIDAENSTVYDDDVAGGYTESDANIASTVAQSENLGLNVMVRPLIDFLPSNYETDPNQPNPKNGSYGAGEFRSYYNPKSPATFFASYQAMIVDQAKIAQANGAQLFCIGTELDQLTGPAYESYWNNIISAVRNVFSGKLTYSADWDDSQSPWKYGGSGLKVGTGDITTQVSFWNKLDYVGIDEYAPISDLANPTLAQLIAGWTQTPTDAASKAVTGNQSLISYYQGVAAALGKPLIFTELGYANSSDADSSPATPGYDENGNPDNAVADPGLQADLYKAFFDAWQQDGNGSLVGSYLWNWEPGGASYSDFSVQAPQAESAVASGYAAACYGTGTRILTDRGEVPIEDLAVGDRLVTAAGAQRPVRWVGRRRLDLAGHPEPRAVWPVRVEAGAFGANRPSRDLWMSPGHNVLAEGVLMPVRALINGATVLQVPVPRVIYWHVELGSHDVILAENLPAESYLDTGNRTAFENGGAFLDLHPDFEPRHWTETCLPLVKAGPAVEAARAALLARAKARGHVSTPVHDLHVDADGRRVAPIELGSKRFAFVLPAGGAAILVSRTFVPCHGDPRSTDSRVLGVAVERLQVDGEAVDLRMVSGSGWHDLEQRADRSRRWTTGTTPLPAGCRLVVVDLVGEGRYWLDRTAHGAAPDRPSGAERWGSAVSGHRLAPAAVATPFRHGLRHRRDLSGWEALPR